MKLFSKNSQETYEILRATDWSKHELGSIESWPDQLITFLNFIYNSKQACFVFWGEKAFCFYNDAYIPVLGVDKHPISIGKKAEVVWAEVWDQISKVNFKSVMAGNSIWNVDKQVTLLRNGKMDEAYFTFGYSPIFLNDKEVGGVLITTTETTDKVEAKNRLLKSEEHLKLATEVTQLGFYDWNIPENIITYNEEMKKCWGLIDNVKLEDFVSCIHPDDQDRVTRTINESIEQKIPYYCKYRLVVDKKIVWIEAKGKVEFQDDKPVRFFGTSSNITEKENIRLDLEKAVTNLETEKGLRERFVAALGHDLRTPLTAAKMNAQLLCRKLSEPDQIKKTKQIVNNIDRVDMMIRDLLDVSRIRAGENISLEIKECDLSQMAEEAIVDLSSLYGERFKLQTKDKITGHWDYDSIKRVIENFASNAVKYGKDSTPIIIGLNQKNDFVEISVHNDGPEISSEDQVRIFEPFKRIDTENENFKGSWGIGLTLVKEYAEAHGGSTNVTSSNDHGTTFSILIPQDSRKKNARTK